MIQTFVINKEVNYDRTGYMTLVDNNVVFDTSDEEYGPVIFSIEVLEKAIDEHNLKRNHNNFKEIKNER